MGAWRSSYILVIVIRTHLMKCFFFAARRMPIQKLSNVVNVVFRTETESITCEARVGTNLLDVAIENDIDLEGACGGTLACSTCHLYIDEENLKKLPPAEEEEEDMLDLAYGLADNSRLGCQCILTKEMDGIICTLPDETSDARGM
eukprot:m.27928 g.27928  ORF g.27928 m.27928 type:complete len:146 (-) comp7954_c0_seq1:69-506(-)